MDNIVLEIGLALEAQAKGGPAVTEGDLSLAMDRVTRAVRYTLMLRVKLAQERDEDHAARSHRQAGLQAGAARIVGGAIEDETRGDAERAEQLRAIVGERLRAENFGDLLSRPFGEAVADICRDLGLPFDELTLIEDCFAVQAALAGKPGKAPEPDDDGPYEVQWLSSSDSS